MSSLARACLGVWILVASWWLSIPEARAQGNLEAANRQYSTASALQQRGAYDLATDEWIKFINTYQADARLDRAFFHLGQCYLQNKHLDQALQCFETVVKTYPKSELLEANYLYLGATQFEAGPGRQGRVVQRGRSHLRVAGEELSQGQVRRPGPVQSR